MLDPWQLMYKLESNLGGEALSVQMLEKTPHVVDGLRPYMAMVIWVPGGRTHGKTQSQTCRLIIFLPSTGEQKILEASHEDLKENGPAVRFFTHTTGR